MTQQLLRIAIIGCGTAGSSAAVLLKRAGHDVHLYEQAPEPRAVGAGFLLQPSGMAVLQELGIHDKIIKHASHIHRLHVLEKDGRDLMELNYHELGENLFGAGLHRPVLMSSLIALMEKESIPIYWDHRIEAAKQLSHGWQINEEAYDLLIVADGARSAMRRSILGEGYDRGYNWGAHWFIGKNNGAYPSADLHQIVNGTRQLAGFLPTGHELGTLDLPENELLSLFWSIRVDEDQELRKQPLTRWKEKILKLSPRAENLLSQITDWDQILTARYGDVRMKQWHGHHLVFLGDAGHAMSPQLGQGVNLALADSSCLAATLREFPLEKALPMFTKRRRLNLKYYQLATRSLTPIFQSDYNFISPLRHLGFRISQRIPPVRKLMTASMAGTIGMWKPNQKNKMTGMQ
ncbi:MAG: FAD-dependent oxidoreductase [Akkermansiaceae bacterium]